MKESGQAPSSPKCAPPLFLGRTLNLVKLFFFSSMVSWVIRSRPGRTYCALSLPAWLVVVTVTHQSVCHVVGGDTGQDSLAVCADDRRRDAITIRCNAPWARWGSYSVRGVGMRPQETEPGEEQPIRGSG